jgi:hypothetical protein
MTRPATMRLRLLCLSARESEMEKPPSLEAAKTNCPPDNKKPRPPGAEHRQTIAHGVSRGFPSSCGPSPGRGDRFHALRLHRLIPDRPLPFAPPGQPKAAQGNALRFGFPNMKPSQALKGRPNRGTPATDHACNPISPFQGSGTTMSPIPGALPRAVVGRPVGAEVAPLSS